MIISVEKIKNLFGAKKVIEDSTKLPKDVPKLEQEEVEIVDFDDKNLALRMHHSYEAENKLNSIRDCILKYREVSQHYEIDYAIQEIINEAIVKDDEGVIIKANIDKLEKLDDTTKEKIVKSFDKILRILKFNKEGEEVFKRWYIDGRMYFHAIFDKSNSKKGIIAVNVLDPKFLIKTKITNKETKKEEYFYYYRPEIGDSLLIPEDHIIFIHSGLSEYNKDIYISHLHKALKPLNDLQNLEHSAIIYRLTRAPERRVFYVDVGKLPPTKAEQYMQNLMRKFQNKLIYDRATGVVSQKKDTMTMIEDFWLPVTSDGRGTKLDTLQGGQQLGEMKDIEYFRNNLLKALNIPSSRFDNENKSTFNFGNSSEITRDEIRFAKFINRLRERFSVIFYELLKFDLIAKGIINIAEWKKYYYNDIYFEWSCDLHFEEIKRIEKIKDRLEVLNTAAAYKGDLLSREWIYKNILDLDEEEITEMQNQLEAERPTVADAEAQLNQTSKGHRGRKKKTLAPQVAPSPFDQNFQYAQQAVAPPEENPFGGEQGTTLDTLPELTP